MLGPPSIWFLYSTEFFSTNLQNFTNYIIIIQKGWEPEIELKLEVYLKGAFSYSITKTLPEQC